VWTLGVASAALENTDDHSRSEVVSAHTLHVNYLLGITDTVAGASSMRIQCLVTSRPGYISWQLYLSNHKLCRAGACECVVGCSLSVRCELPCGEVRSKELAKRSSIRHYIDHQRDIRVLLSALLTCCRVAVKFIASSALQRSK
jgi:hypothetical protein